MTTFEVKESQGLLYVEDVEDLLGIGREECYMISNGRLVSRSDPLEHGRKYCIFPRVLGGKGGFGSMLRAIGAQIEKTTSREACRDLSGRRIRDVNNEKKLKEWWVTKQADREREREEREERRRARRAKYLEENVPKMNNPEYDAQYSEIMKRSEEAIQKGLARLKDGKPVSRKRKAETSTCSALDKYDRWNMMGGLNPDDLDSDSGSESGEGSSSNNPGTSAQPEDMTASSSSPSSSSQGAPASPKASAESASISFNTDSFDPSVGPSPAKAPRLAASASGDEAISSSSEKQGEASSTHCEVPEKAGPVLTSETSQSTEPIDLDQYSGPEDLQALGMEHLKMDLMRRGLKCGGSLEERAQRLFSVRGLSPEDIPAKLLAKGKGQGKSSRK